MLVKGFAAPGVKKPLGPFQFERRKVGPNDIQIDISHCGVCHSDVHQARDEWGGAIFPMVPGHEIVGTVSAVGNKVSRFKAGELVGVGCMVDSCHNCDSCKHGDEQYCDGPCVYTYNGYEYDKKTPTYGGYSASIVVDHNFVLKVPKSLDPAGAAPLLCAGITTYSPLHHFKVGKGHRLGVVGLGGLGHMAVKMGAAMGADVTVLSTSKKKEADAHRLGAKDFTVVTGDVGKSANKFDFMINTVSAKTDMDMYLNMLKLDGTMILVGVPPEPLAIPTHTLVGRRRRIVGSLIGGIRETQEMLNFSAEHNIVSDIELIKLDYINEAYDRMVKGDVHYRFVVDIKASL